MKQPKKVNIYLKPGEVKSSYFGISSKHKTYEIGEVRDETTHSNEYLFSAVIRMDNQKVVVSR